MTARFHETVGNSAATSLANWAQFEARHPDTFAAMYQFWVYHAGANGALRER